MALNDRDPTLGGALGVDAYPGVANPTKAGTHSNPLASNFVTDPTTDDRGAGAGANFHGDANAAKMFSQTAGVVEGRPNIIESTHIDPLAEGSNKDDGWANATITSSTTTTTNGTSTTGTVSNLASNATMMATGAAKLAYGHATGDEAHKAEGREALGV